MSGLDPVHQALMLIGQQAAEIERLTARLHMAAGLISTTDTWKDKHPQDCLEWVMSWEGES